MKLSPRRSSNGFTLAETLVAATIGSFVIMGVMVLYVEFLWSYSDTTMLRNTSSRASLALERMVHGIGTNAGLLEAQVTGMTVSTNNNWRIAYTNLFSASPNPLFFQYASASGLITNESGKIICSNVIASSLVFTTSAVGGATNGCGISVTVSESSGKHISTNVMTTFIQFRNP
ncbi:MAG: prepilin-type N-terminal cleavage/methylation domain-containing protein [Verrucomicrobiia bacterium]